MPRVAEVTTTCISLIDLVILIQLKNGNITLITILLCNTVPGWHTIEDES